MACVFLIGHVEFIPSYIITWNSDLVKHSYIVLIVGTVMLIMGNFLGNALLNSIFTNNSNHSHLINDVNQDLLSLSNSLLIMSKLGIIVLVLGGIIFVKDRIKK